VFSKETAAEGGGLMVYKSPSGKGVIRVKHPNFRGDREVDEWSP